MLRVVSSFLLVALLSIGLAAAQSSQPGVGPETVAQHYGYITVNTTRHLYYWMFESRNDPAKDPFVLWMTGGPGCSSMLALFYENGPYNINPDLSLSLNPYSWNNNATVLFIDQPVGTGFSYADSGDFGVVTEEQMADNMYEFFQNFFAQFPQYANLPFFVFGESYAGHYVPAFSARILEGNQRNEGAHINLVGSAIGNGLVDPQVQYGEYWRYAQDHNLVSATSVGMMKGLAPVCQALISGCAQNSTLGWLACINAYTMCNMAELMPVQFTNINLYDVREQCKVPPLCYDFSLLPKYLGQPEVSKALGVVKTWQDCNRIVDMKMVFAGDWMLNFAQDIPKLLAAGHRVLVYAGEYDFICNWYGNHAWMQQLQWPGQAAFNQAPNATWAVDGVPAGVVQGAQGLTFLKVLNAGHMVPHDQPKNSYMMMLQFLTGEL